MMSGVTDCYQPVESKLKITRQCLQVLAEARQPVGIVTKSRLILRDLDLLTQLSRCGAVKVAVSLTTLDNDLAAKMEPRAASPRDRLWTMRRLASAGVAVSAMVAPVIPAINDRQVPAILKAAADAGATSAGYVLVRLPYQIKDLFEDWLARHMPQRQKRVQRLIRQARGGKLYEAEWGTRMCGQGAYARQIGKTFELFAARYGLTNGHEPMNTGAFRRPRDSAQMSLFDDD
jgi:DNA repair photolyase